MAAVRRLRQRRGWAYAIVIALTKTTLKLTSRPVRIDAEKIPAAGGCVVVANHISYIDPFALGNLLVDYGRLVRYLAKDALWRIPVLRHIPENAGQIPVARSVGSAAGAFDAAVEAIRRGECLGVYPEGSVTRDPDGWPMRGKSGAARIALMTGCPVIPIGQWGAQDLLPAYSKRLRPFPRKTTTYKVGDPVYLADLRDRPLTPEVLAEATDRIMAAITSLVEDIRGAEAPAVRFDPKSAGMSETGDYRRGGAR